MMQVRLIGTELELGCGTKGTSKAWSALKPSLEEMCTKLGIASTSSTISADNTNIQPVCDGLKNAPEIIKTLKTVCAETQKAKKEADFVLNIGGDHSIGYATVAGMTDEEHIEELSVIWIDTHTDINTEKTSETHNIHGMPNAASLGLCCDTLCCLGSKKKKINPENLYILGAHDIDLPEYDICSDNGVNLYKVKDIKERGLDDVLGEILSKAKTKRVHLSFDVDVLDASQFKSTGIALSGGLTIDEVKYILRVLTTYLPVHSMDCVEYNPTYDSDFKDKETILELIQAVLEQMKEKE